jgi:mRNA-degrading endonuclease RelE of RelBE toxin-antitoxin system
MSRVPRELIEHELHLDPKAKPVKQRLRDFTQDRKDVIEKEITRLLYTDFIKEVYHPIGSPIPFLYPNRIKIGGYVLIISILIRHVKKILSGFP